MTRTPLSRSNGQGHQAALLSAALTRKAAAAVSVGTYSAWKSTATLRLLGEVRRGAGHIVSPRAQLVNVESSLAIKLESPTRSIKYVCIVTQTAVLKDKRVRERCRRFSAVRRFKRTLR